MVANLFIEYIGYPAFQDAIRQVDALYASCVIQINADECTWISESPYLHVFDGLDAIHHQMDGKVLTKH